MTDPANTLILATAALLGIAIMSVAGLKGLNAWLGFRRLEIDAARAPSGEPGTLNRIELADLKERLRKLEALAAGVDL